MVGIGMALYSCLLFVFLQYVQADPPNSKGLAQLVMQLIQFQEDNFGKNVSKPLLTRLPVGQISYFISYSENYGVGLLHFILG